MHPAGMCVHRCQYLPVTLQHAVVCIRKQHADLVLLALHRPCSPIPQQDGTLTIGHFGSAARATIVA